MPQRVSFKDLNIERSPLASSFRHIPGGWRNYIDYARMSASDGNEDMTKFIKAYDALTPKERRTIMPEQVCDQAGVKQQDLIGQVTSHLWLANSNEGMQISAISHPRVMEALVASATMVTPDTYKDRELFLRSIGGLPDKKGNAMVINVNTQQTNASASFGGQQRGGSTLNSFRDDILEMEQITDGGEVIDISAQPVTDQQFVTVDEDVDDDE